MGARDVEQAARPPHGRVDAGQFDARAAVHAPWAKPNQDMTPPPMRKPGLTWLASLRRSSRHAALHLHKTGPDEQSQELV